MWLRENFGTLLLAFLFLVIVALTVHLAHSGLNPTWVDKVWERGGEILAALLALLTGRGIARAAEQQPPAPPSPPEAKP